MPVVPLVVHPRGLHPIMQVKAHHLHVEEGMSLEAVRGEVHNLQGRRPGRSCVFAAVKCVAETLQKPQDSLVPETKYKNCGRRMFLDEMQKLALVDYVERWRAKVFRHVCLHQAGAQVGRVQADHRAMPQRLRLLSNSCVEQNYTKTTQCFSCVLLLSLLAVVVVVCLAVSACGRRQGRPTRVPKHGW